MDVATQIRYLDARIAQGESVLGLLQSRGEEQAIANLLQQLQELKRQREEVAHIQTPSKNLVVEGDDSGGQVPGPHRLVYPGQGGPSERELAEIVQRVNHEGYVLLWSTVLADFVAFYKTEADRKKIPPGFVPYSEQELEELFGEGKDAPSPNALRLTHESQKCGERVIGSQPEHGKEAT